MTSQPREPRLPRRVLLELQGTDWHIERGSRHWRLMIGNKQVLVFGARSFGQDDHGSSQISAAAIRRFKRMQEARP